jgi:hypothetical protein
MNKKIKNLIIIMFAPAIIFWSLLGFYYDIVYHEETDINELIIELKESVKNDLERT